MAKGVDAEYHTGVRNPTYSKFCVNSFQATLQVVDKFDVKCLEFRPATFRRWCALLQLVDECEVFLLGAAD